MGEFQGRGGAVEVVDWVSFVIRRMIVVGYRVASIWVYIAVMVLRACTGSCEMPSIKESCALLSELMTVSKGQLNFKIAMHFARNLLGSPRMPHFCSQSTIVLGNYVHFT